MTTQSKLAGAAILAVVGGLAVSLVVSDANAGAQFTSTVSVTSSHRASGSIGATRNSANTTERISCSYRVTAATTTSFTEEVYCSATNASGAFAWCRSSAPEMARAVWAMNDASYIQFEGFADGTCRVINVWTDSVDPPREL